MPYVHAQQQQFGGELAPKGERQHACEEYFSLEIDVCCCHRAEFLGGKMHGVCQNITLTCHEKHGH